MQKLTYNWTREQWKSMYGIMRGMVRGLDISDFKWSDDPYQRLTWQVRGPIVEHHINVYNANRAFGGREEGGWWYDCGELLTTKKVNLPMSYWHLDRLRKRLRKEMMGQERYSKSSVLCSGVIEVEVSDEPGADYPSERPYYE